MRSLSRIFWPCMTAMISIAILLCALDDAQAKPLTQKGFHTRLTMAQITAISLDHLLQPEYAARACQALYGQELAQESRDEKEELRTQLQSNMGTFTTAIINDFYMAHDTQPDSTRFFAVYREKAKDFEAINRKNLEDQKELFYPYLKASKFFSKQACETGAPWPSSLEDIRAEMDSLPVLKVLGDTFQTTYRSILQ